MKKTYLLDGLDCANCAAKIENGILKIDGVTKCVVNFMTQKMVFEAEDVVYDAAFSEAKKVIKKVDSDIVITEK